MQYLHSYLTPQRQAHIYASGLTAIIALGTLALVAICLVAVWGVLQFALFALNTVVASCNELASTFASSDPIVRLILICAAGLLIYQIVRRVRKA